MKHTYSEYVAGALGYFVRHKHDNPPVELNTEALRLNWNACEVVFGNLSKQDQAIVECIYADNGNLNDVIKAYCGIRNLKPAYVWHKVQDIEESIAKVRGLI